MDAEVARVKGVLAEAVKLSASHRRGEAERRGLGGGGHGGGCQAAPDPGPVRVGGCSPRCVPWALHAVLVAVADGLPALFTPGWAVGAAAYSWSLKRWNTRAPFRSRRAFPPIPGRVGEGAGRAVNVHESGERGSTGASVWHRCM